VIALFVLQFSLTPPAPPAATVAAGNTFLDHNRADTGPINPNISTKPKIFVPRHIAQFNGFGGTETADQELLGLPCQRFFLFAFAAHFRRVDTVDAHGDAFAEYGRATGAADADRERIPVVDAGHG
jgi:hypothetical protein